MHPEFCAKCNDFFPAGQVCARCQPRWSWRAAGFWAGVAAIAAIGAVTAIAGVVAWYVITHWDSL